MKFSHVLAALQFTGIVAASPLFIVTRAPDFNGRALERRKHHPSDEEAAGEDDPFGSLVSDFFGADDSTTAGGGITLPPPAVASPTADASPTDEESSPEPTEPPSPTEEPTPSTTEESTTSEPTTTESTTSSAPTSTITPPPKTAAPVASSTATPAAAASKDDGNAMPTAGIAVLAVFAVIVIAAIIWAIFRYNPRARAWWVNRGEKKMEERTWREALDGPTAATAATAATASAGAAGAAGGGVSQLRQKALMDDGPIGGTAQQQITEKQPAPNRKSMFETFFAPAAARIASTQEIKRKPVQWGSPSPSSPSTRGSFVSEKMSLAQTAAPMGRSNTDRSLPPALSSGPPPPQRMSVAAHPDFGLPPTMAPPPPMPAASNGAVQKARRGSDGVYRLN